MKSKKINLLHDRERQKNALNLLSAHCYHRVGSNTFLLGYEMNGSESSQA